MINWRSFVLIGWTMGWTVIGLIVALLDPRGKLFVYLARVGWARSLLWLAGIDLEVRAAEGIDWKKPYVVCANHLSQLDIPVSLAALPMPLRFLAKRALFFIPVFGWAIFLARFIPVDRGNREKARRSIDKGARRIRKGPSLIIFPEGTRSPDGQLQKFKSGAFVMAVRAEVPVLPMAIHGTFEVVPKTRLAVHPGRVLVVIGAPIPTAGLGMKGKEPLKKRTHAAIAEMLETGQPTSADT